MKIASCDLRVLNHGNNNIPATLKKLLLRRARTYNLRGKFILSHLAELLSDVDKNCDAPLNDPRLRIDRESDHRILNGVDTK